MLTTIETIASVSSGVATIIVAVVALVFSYRQNVGWKPVLLLHHPTLSGNAGGTKAMELTVEFWNRRKYPLVMHGLTAQVTGALVREEEFAGRGRPFVRASKLFLESDAVVQPSDRNRVVIRLGLEDQSLDALRPSFLVKVEYFDPYLNRTEERRSHYKFFYPELGWKKSAAELVEAERAYGAMRSDREDTPRNPR